MSKAKLTKKDKLKIFNDAAKYSYLDVGRVNDLEEWYSSDASMRAAVGRIVRDVGEHPESYGISSDKVKMVKEIIDERKQSGKNQAAKVYEKKKVEAYMDKPIEEIVTSNRNKLSAIMNKKADMLLKDEKQLKETSLSQLSTAFGVMFDKGQILRGEATEHIAFQGNISQDMDPNEAIEAVVKMRESNVEQNNK